MSKFKYYKRGFLNREKGTAIFEADVSIEDYEDEGSFSANFDISDCYKKISLDFYVGSKKQLTEKLRKVDNLIKELTNFKEAMIRASMVKKEKKEEK
jgi:hypothetical protein